MSDSCLGRKEMFSKDRDLLCSCSPGCWPVLIMPGADASADAVSIKNSSCGVLDGTRDLRTEHSDGCFTHSHMHVSMCIPMYMYRPA